MSTFLITNRPPRTYAMSAQAFAAWTAWFEQLGPNLTEVEFKIFPHGEHTYVHFRHSGFAADTADFPWLSMSWAIRLLSLKELLEKGQGHPFPNNWIDQ